MSEAIGIKPADKSGKPIGSFIPNLKFKIMKIRDCTLFNLNTHESTQVELGCSEHPPYLEFNVANILTVSVLGLTPFARVQNLNYILQTYSWIPLCNGARGDAYMSGMLSDCSNGESIYVGKSDYNTPIMSIYEPAPKESILIYGPTQDTQHLQNSYQAILADSPYIRRKKQDWLFHYFKFRETLEQPSIVQAKSYLESVGQNSSDLALRFRGCLLGLAVCDALGTSLEFTRRDEKTISDLVGGGPFNLRPGQWTDDTSMALCSAESLLASEGFNPKKHMELYRLWRDTGKNSSTDRCFDIGHTVNSAITAYLKFGNPLAGPTDPKTAGNGSLMRIAPDVLFHFFSPTEVNELSAISSRITHGATEAIDACRYFGILLHGALKGVTKEVLFDGLYSPEDHFWDDKTLCTNVLNIAKGCFKQKIREEIKSTGYVIDTLEAALWAFYHTDNFKDGALLAVNLGGDADTIGAVYGQLAGTYYMEPQIPIGWLKKTYAVDRLFDLSDELLSYACSNY